MSNTTPQTTAGTRVLLAEANPPVALGALDGRYRTAVAPLVDHLSEAALNRERLHVEVEWLIHLTSQQVVPGAPTLSDNEQGYLRAIVSDSPRPVVDRPTNTWARRSWLMR